MIRGVGFGRMFADATFGTFEVTRHNREAFEACQAVARRESNGVVLIGPGGVGKTHLLRALAVEYDRLHTVLPTADDPAAPTVSVPSASELIRLADPQGEVDDAAPTLDPEEMEHQATIDYWPMLDLAVRLRSAALHGETEVSEDCCGCDLLILDDLGHERTSDFILQEFRRIVDWRYREKRSIAIATNLTKEQIIDKYGEHTYSRWLGSCEIVEVSGSDYRMDRGPARR